MFASRNVVASKKHPFLVLMARWSQAIASRKYWKKASNKPRYVVDDDFLSVMRMVNVSFVAYMNKQEGVIVPPEVETFIEQNMGNMSEEDFDDFLMSPSNFTNTNVDELVDAATLLNGKLQTLELKRDIRYANVFVLLIEWFAVATKNNYKQEVFDNAQNTFYTQPCLVQNLGQFYKAIEK